jgi:hypothetical protein
MQEVRCILLQAQADIRWTWTLKRLRESLLHIDLLVLPDQVTTPATLYLRLGLCRILSSSTQTEQAPGYTRESSLRFQHQIRGDTRKEVLQTSHRTGISLAVQYMTVLPPRLWVLLAG